MSLDKLRAARIMYVNDLREAFESICVEYADSPGVPASYICKASMGGRVCQTLQLGDIIMQSGKMKLRSDEFWLQSMSAISIQLEHLTENKITSFPTTFKGFYDYHSHCSWTTRIKEKATSIMTSAVASIKLSDCVQTTVAKN